MSITPNFLMWSRNLYVYLLNEFLLSHISVNIWKSLLQWLGVRGGRKKKENTFVWASVLRGTYVREDLVLKSDILTYDVKFIHDLLPSSVPESGRGKVLCRLHNPCFCEKRRGGVGLALSLSPKALVTWGERYIWITSRAPASSGQAQCLQLLVGDPSSWGLVILPPLGISLV